MQQPRLAHVPARASSVAAIAAALAGLGLVAGLAFGGWAAHGPEMLNAIWVAGLSWCG